MALTSEEKILRKVIITSAITGAGALPTMSDYLPITPKQIADDAVKSYEAGARSSTSTPVIQPTENRHLT